MIEASCHCGAVRLTVPSLPAALTDCNCSICRRIGGLWAYYSPSEVTVTGETVAYVQGDRMLELRHCPTCGCVTHWTPAPATRADQNRMGVNARQMDPTLITPIRVRHLDGADTWTYLD